MLITLITPTCDQPIGISLCEQFMARQTIPYDQWIVVDDGLRPAALTMGQEHVVRTRETDCTPAQSLCRNLLAAIALSQGDLIVLIEHDDWYAPSHLETIVAQLAGADAMAAGDDRQRYYNVAHRRWRVFDNVGASLCQTAFRRAVLGEFQNAVRRCLRNNWFHVDRTFWDEIPEFRRSLRRTNTAVGIKGLPGRPGIGIGHRPTGPLWNADPSLEYLRRAIGADADLYRDFAMQRVAA